MSKFCKNCGTALVNSACPKCPKEDSQVSAVVKSVASSFFENIKRLIKNPITTTKKLLAKEENYKFGLMLIGVVTVILLLAVCLIVKESFTFIMGLVALSGAESVLDLSSMAASIPYGRILIYMILFFAASTAILMFSVWATHKWAFKKDISFKKTITFIAVTYLPTGIALLLAIPVLYIFPGLLIGIAGLGGLAYYAMYMLNMKHLSDIVEDKIFYVIAISFLVNFILQYIIIGKLLLGMLF